MSIAHALPRDDQIRHALATLEAAGVMVDVFLSAKEAADACGITMSAVWTWKPDIAGRDAHEYRRWISRRKLRAFLERHWANVPAAVVHRLALFDGRQPELADSLPGDVLEQPPKPDVERDPAR